MNNITDHDWEYKGFDGRIISNDWYIVPITVIITVIAFIALVGPEDFFNVMVRFVTSL